MSVARAGGRAAPPLERLVERDRAVIAGALGVVAAAAWLYLLRTTPGMTGAGGMSGMAMPQMRTGAPLQLVVLFTMWATMMVAMMLPSAAPMVLLFATVSRRRRERNAPAVPAVVFVAGYLLVWAGFSVGAALLQLVLHRAMLISPAMASTSPTLSGLLLFTAGAYQWLPAKQLCLTRCRSPLAFLGSEWREGPAGALVMGARHGLFCMGCCWALMLLLFVAGVMNVLWVAAIAVLVLVERLAPAGRRMGRAAGAACIAWGAWLVLGAW